MSFFIFKTKKTTIDNVDELENREEEVADELQDQTINNLDQ